MNRTTFFLALLGTALAGCGAGEEKLDPQFQKSFEDQGKRSSGQINAANPAMRGQALPPGTTPPPSNP